MMDRPELNTFLVQPPSKDRSQIVIFLGPAIHGGINKERIFILAEIPSSNFEFKNQIQIFINQLAKKYQELEKENPIIAFENSLEWANRELKENFEPSELIQLSLIFGGLRNEQLQFAAGGKNNAHIFYRDQEGYKNTDLLKNYSTENTETNIFFANLISGSIHQNNFVLFSTPTVLNYLTIDRLQKIITSNKTDEIGARLEDLLSQIENKVSFGGIIISWAEDKNTNLPKSTFKLTPNESIGRLLRQQKETDQIMSPAVLQSIKKYLQNKKNKNTVATEEEKKTLQKINKIYHRLNGWPGKISAAWQKILLTLGKIIYGTLIFLKNIFKKIIYLDIRSPHKVLTYCQRLPSQIGLFIKKQIIAIKIKFLSLSLKKRILFSLTFVSLVFLIISLLLIFSNLKTNHSSTAYNQTLEQIKNQIGEAESYLIYKNEDKAGQLIKEIKVSLDRLPVNSENQKKSKEELTDSLQPLIYKIQKIQQVSSTLELDLSKLGLTNKPESLIKTVSYFVFLTPKSSTINLYNRISKKNIEIKNEQITSWKNVSLQKDETILIIYNDDSLTQFDPETQTFTLKDASWPNKDRQISLVATYNSKLYSLDSKNNQIFKHFPSTTGFGKGENWINPNSEINFSDAVSMVIDGNIYVARKNGQIYKLESGNLISFDINFLDPVLTSIKNIYTKNGSDLLFVLDREKQRVIIWNKKNNKLISQLTSSEWTDLNDLVADEKEGKIYLLNNLNILSVKY
ncbi:MAG TPA: hypothetical protein PKY08_01795 [Candidatus Magasanikbacteria bacterium]|nr:hypothetical protein [Candidatus Magasanikbacteria bacterium]